MDSSREAARRRVLLECGATEGLLGELVAYNANPFDPARLERAVWPIPDEPSIEIWDQYERESREIGVLSALARRLVQLRFPIEAGISQTDGYRAATRRGIWPEREAPGVTLERSDDLELRIHPTPAGRLPILTAGCRSDFVALVRAFSARNEPERVPESMGACIVSGLNNWDRVARHRRMLEQRAGAPLTEEQWAEAFRDLVPLKPLYQDRFIVLSRQPYSAVPAADIGLDEDAWLRASVAVRCEHECTHYLMLRAFGIMRNNLLDEVVADFAGLTAAFGRYESRLALRVLGLDAFPQYRAGARFENYLGTPPLSPRAVEVQQAVVVRAVRKLERVAAASDLSSRGERSRMVVALAGLTLEELASDAASDLVAARLAGLTTFA